MTALGALAFTLAASVSTHVFQGRELQPETYISPSGEWSLRVERSKHFEPKQATYVMTCGGQEAWRIRHPFALWLAAVNDDGGVAGTTYSGNFNDLGSALRVVLLAPDGHVLLDEPHERVSSGYSHSNPVPVAARVFFQSDLERFVVQVSDREREGQRRGFSAFWVYDLHTGVALSRHRFERETGPHLTQHVIDARPLPATPLTLLHWNRTDYTTDPWTRGGVFELVDADWNVVWTLGLQHDYEVGGDQLGEQMLQDELRKKGAILSTGPGRFELRFVAERQRVRFAAERAGTRWSVREIGRAPFVQEAPHEIPVQRPRLLSLITLGEDDPPTAEPWKKLGRAALARLDRLTGWILIADRTSGAIHVFDANGRQLSICLPGEASGDKESPRLLFCYMAGRLYVSYSDSTDRYLRFSPEGTFEGVQQLPEGRTFTLPEGEHAWGITSELTRSYAGTSGKPLHLDKRPDGDWFRRIMDVAVSGDGSLAVLEQPVFAPHAPGYIPGPPADSVSILGPEGEPRSVHALPASIEARELLFAGKMILLTDGRRRVHRLDPASGELVRLDLDDVLEQNRSFELGLSPDGTELWVLGIKNKEFLRFALGE